MKERPILFSGPMVRAILEGRKTQTRRVMNPQPWVDRRERQAWKWSKHGREKGPWACWATQWPPTELLLQYMETPHWKGDRLWVRETFLNNALEGYTPIYFYRADDDDKPEDRSWRPSIFMPRKASRLNLEVAEVRVERVQEISEKDAMAEGVDWKEHAGLASKTARKLFAELWNLINGKRAKGKYAWERNPWVWVTEFKVLPGRGNGKS